MTTTLHTIHTAKAKSRAGMLIHRLRVAMRLPVFSQNVASSGFHSVSTKGEGWDSSGKSVEAVASCGAKRRSALAMVKCIHVNATVTNTNNSMKQLVHRPVRSNNMPKVNGSRKPPKPPIMPTTPPTAPTLFG